MMGWDLSDLILSESFSLTKFTFFIIYINTLKFMGKHVLNS